MDFIAFSMTHLVALGLIVIISFFILQFTLSVVQHEYHPLPHPMRRVN